MYEYPDIQYLQLQFTLKAESHSYLPPFKGSMLRGAFGHALRCTVCVMKPGADCADCMLRTQCAYTRIFEPFIETDPPPFLKGIRTAPRPFVIDAFDDQTKFQPGDLLTFNFTLIGKACDFAPYVIFAFQRAAETGITVRRHKFTIQNVTCGGETVYDGAKQALINALHPGPIDMEANGKPVRQIRFLTPTRIKLDSKLTIDFPFRTLIFNMLRRHLELTFFYMPNAEIDWDLQSVLDAAKTIEVTERHLSWTDLERYSNRQKSKLLMGGFTGVLKIEGDMAPIVPVLKSAEVLHVGKGAVMGLGKVDLGG